jgi:hypothetical protein
MAKQLSFYGTEIFTTAHHLSLSWDTLNQFKHSKSKTVSFLVHSKSSLINNRTLLDYWNRAFSSFDIVEKIFTHNVSHDSVPVGTAVMLMMSISSLRQIVTCKLVVVMFRGFSLFAKWILRCAKQVCSSGKTSNLWSWCVSFELSWDRDNVTWRDFRFPLRYNMRSALFGEILRSVGWKFLTEVSGKFIGPIFSGQAVQDLFISGTCSVPPDKCSYFIIHWTIQRCIVLATGFAKGKRWHGWLRHCVTSRKVAGSTGIGIFNWHNPSGRTTALGSIQSLTDSSTRNISWRVKADGALAWQPYHLHMPIVLKSLTLSLLGPSWPTFRFFFTAFIK